MEVPLSGPAAVCLTGGHGVDDLVSGVPCEGMCAPHLLMTLGTRWKSHFPLFECVDSKPTGDSCQVFAVCCNMIF